MNAAADPERDSDDARAVVGAGAVSAAGHARATRTSAHDGPVGGPGLRSGPAGGTSTATLEDLFTGSASTDHIGSAPPPKNKRRRRIGGWIALGVVLLLLGGIAGGAWYVWNTYEDSIREVMGWEEPKDYEDGLANGETFVTIASGDTGSPISQSLYDAGVTKMPDAFYDYLIESGQNPNFQPGVYRLQKQMTSEAALASLMDPANKMELTAQIPEGFTVDGTLERLAEGTGIPLEEFTAAAADPAAFGVPANSLEGWLFPATYTFDPSVTAQSAIQTLVDRAKQSLDAAGVPEADRQEILTIASIIQREARYEQDMQRVSRVIQNRLDPSNQETFGLLQMDSTAQYGIGEDDGTVSSSEEALTDDNPWNTYVHPGLPVGPISNPGDVAIDAAMHPADGDWLYFVTVNLDTGETVFTSNLADHNRAVNQWQQWCSQQNPDSGC
ncbi:endolytic transglycosylase MltG [Microbacterium yannicii]|uniref:endolytic transglycosylase MltG n=1 Tax=Microbacterium yannicii TaxID=671622 RepID=UPI0002FDA5D0|nr:endolytic transglycosylase MltG [Microbacterium yannicii]